MTLKPAGGNLKKLRASINHLKLDEDGIDNLDEEMQLKQKRKEEALKK